MVYDGQMAYAGQMVYDGWMVYAGRMVYAGQMVYAEQMIFSFTYTSLPIYIGEIILLKIRFSRETLFAKCVL